MKYTSTLVTRNTKFDLPVHLFQAYIDARILVWIQLDPPFYIYSFDNLLLVENVFAKLFNVLVLYV